MTTRALFQGIPILIEVHLLPHAQGTTYGILFAIADTDDVIGFVTDHNDAITSTLEPTDVVLLPTFTEAAALLVEMGFVLPTERWVEVQGTSMPIYQLTEQALAHPIA